MIDNSVICPYPGLRSFNEDESIFFKGRDEQIEDIIHLLQSNKFLMVTGASGDGKSSLVFGGLIPNARAGFFKAKYNNWKVAHFRPERSPLGNMTEVMVEALEIESKSSFETEIKRGYSSLVELYKNSNLYEKNEDGDRNNQCANLLIVVDQFEEIFTNTENFNKGMPTVQAQTCVNVLLETSKIALRDDLPIFVVFTMRSDFIGQCTAFRGLPEQIGFSQFFVPRLKRKELKQVILEPAQLSGCLISNRLVERMLYDLEEGIDQLPILQHALNQIWQAANMGQDELDLIHYAKVGGMPVEDLPDEDIQVFNSWYSELPEWKKELYTKTGLNRILDIHANILYYSAWEYYRNVFPDQPLSTQECKFIIAMTFACLTKIDDSRAVRNRMTLQEITDIINEPKYSTKEVGTVINYFREPGNTFIHPFINPDDSHSTEIESNSILDITHEALIRNWEKLDKWVEKEHEYYEVYGELKKQLDRWVSNNYSSKYLLPIGSLTYFEEWYHDCKPNKYWIARYMDEEKDLQQNLESADKILRDIQLFLKRSKRNLFVTYTFMKYGSLKLATAFAILCVIVLSSFYYVDAERKQNEHILQEIDVSTTELILNSEVDPLNKGLYMIYSERLSPGSITNKLNQIENIEGRIEVANNIYYALLYPDRYNRTKVKSMTLDYIGSQLNNIDSVNHSNSKLKLLNSFLLTLDYDQYFNRSKKIDSIQLISREKLFSIVKNILSKHDSSIDPLFLNRAIDHIMTIGLTEVQIHDLIKQISPFNDGNSRLKFENYFPVDGGISISSTTLKHNGGYHMIASLYASIGDLEHVNMCLDSLIKYNSDYFRRSATVSGYNLTGFLEKYGHSDKLMPFMEKLSDIQDKSLSQCFQELADRTGYVKMEYIDQYFTDVYYNNILSNLNFKSYEHIYDLWEAVLNTENLTTDEYNFRMALLLKQRACILDKTLKDQGMPSEFEDYVELLDKSVRHYQNISLEYLNEQEQTTYHYRWNQERKREVSRKEMFLYPDYYINGHFNNAYTGTLFVDYLIETNKLYDLYQNLNELELFNSWITNYVEVLPPWDENYRNAAPISYRHMNSILNALKKHSNFTGFNPNTMLLLITNAVYEVGDNEQAYKYYKQLNVEELAVTAGKMEVLNKRAIYNGMLKLSRNLFLDGYSEESLEIIPYFPEDRHKVMAYLELTNAVYETENKEKAFILLDSAYNIINGLRTDDFAEQSYRFELLWTLGKIGGDKMNSVAKQILIDIPDFAKSYANIMYAGGISAEGNFYNAYNTVSTDMTMVDELFCYTMIVAEELMRQKEYDKDWKTLDQAYNRFKDELFF